MGADLGALLGDVLAGHRLTAEEALTLLDVKGRDAFLVAAAADEMRERKVGDVVTFVLNQNIHITNICKNLCGLCGFGRSEKAPDAYFRSDEEVAASARQARGRGVTEVCLLSGVHPDFTVESYEHLIALIHEVIPDADIHGMSPDEVSHAANKSGLFTAEVLARFREAGLGTLQGTAAEILVDSVRQVICPAKISTSEWVRIIKEAHGMGIRSTATIMYGSVDTAADRIEHLDVLRQIQDETGGFTELVPMSWLYHDTPLYRRGAAPAGATGREDLLLIAVARLFLDNFDHIQVSWGKLGVKMSQLCLAGGGDDLGGTMFVDDVSLEAGGEGSDYLAPSEMARMAAGIGRRLARRSTTYELFDQIYSD